MKYAALVKAIRSATARSQGRAAADRSLLSIRQTVSSESPTPLTPVMLLRLSWSHLVELDNKRFKEVTA
jgi:hypothetical protein